MKPGMIKDQRRFIIFLIVFTNLLGFGIVIPLLPYYLETFGAGVTVLGLLASVYSLGQFLAAPFLGHLSDKLGRRPILLLSILGTAISFFLMAMAKSLAVLFLARIIDGLSGGNIATAQAYMADITSKKERSHGLGVIMAAMSLGMILGPAFGGLLTVYGYKAPFLAAAFIALLASLLTFFFLPESRPRQKNLVRTKLNWRQNWALWRYPRLKILISLSFVAMLSFALIQSVFAFFSEHRLGLNARSNGLVFTYIGILGVISQLVLLKQVSRRQKWLPTALLFSGSMMAVALLLIAASRNFFFLLLAVSFLALGRGLFRPLLLGEISKAVPEDYQGAAAGLNQAASSLGRLIGPLLGAFLYRVFQPTAPFYLAGLLLLVFLWFPGRKASRPS